MEPKLAATASEFIIESKLTELLKKQVRLLLQKMQFRQAFVKRMRKERAAQEPMLTFLQSWVNLTGNEFVVSPLETTF